MKGYIDKNKTKQSKNTEIHWQEKKDVVSSTAAMMAFYNTKKKKRVMRPISRWFKKNKRKTNDTTGQTNAIDVIEVLAFFTRLRETL
jgi:dihydrodipicolinate reductase